MDIWARFALLPTTYYLYYNKRRMKRLLIFTFSILLIAPSFAFAQETQDVRATVTNIVQEQTIDGQQLIIFEAIDQDGESYRVDTAQGYTKGFEYRIDEGSKVTLQVINNVDGTQTVFLADIIRTQYLFWMIGLFALITIIVGMKRGALALVGLSITLAVLFLWIMPRIIAGGDPVLTVILGGAFIMLVNMHLVHGFKKKTFVAFGGIIVGLGLVAGLAALFSYFTQLTGLAHEDASFLFFQMPEVIVPKGVLLAGMILGALGVLDDIAITQQEAVSELIEANDELDRKELFKRAMRIGRHHIASMVNTLVLAYAGAALPLFLLFYITGSVDWTGFINTEVVAEEIIRTIAGTTGLVLLVPISTWFAVLAQKR